MTEDRALVDDLLAFLAASPTPFHAVAESTARLLRAGFERLDEGAAWALQPGGRYLLSRNGSSLIAYVHGRRPQLETGLRLIGAHTDSPCLKLRPRALLRERGYLRLGVEVYGGALLNPWFDRDLSLAGRVTVSTPAGLRHVLIDLRRPVAIIPSLAIHLDREQNRSKTVDAQRHLPAILALDDGGDEDFETLLLGVVRDSAPGAQAERVLDFELSLYDVQAPARIGLREEFIASARLDNLLSCHAGVQAIAAADSEVSTLLVCNDHEEVGSQSAIGAQGPMLRQFFERVIADVETRERVLKASMLISVDNAHGVHPNFPDYHDAQHGPLLNGGPVIKVNASQRYASNSETASIYRWLCHREGVPVQDFVSRSDLPCGSTIGPITAAELGLRTLDLGVPTFAMHSVRELAGCRDVELLQRVLGAFLALPELPVGA
jgi:aspartyl aminopeptidase